MFAGIIARPAAISLLTNSGVISFTGVFAPKLFLKGGEGGLTTDPDRRWKRAEGGEGQGPRGVPEANRG